VSEDEALNPALKFGDIAQAITRFDSSSNFILRVLHALRGEFYLHPSRANQNQKPLPTRSDKEPVFLKAMRVLAK
jgi:hypothetical protein